MLTHAELDYVVDMLYEVNGQEDDVYNYDEEGYDGEVDDGNLIYIGRR